LQEVVVLGLAATRLARAVAVDDVSQPARDHLQSWSRRPGAGRWRTWLDSLVHCPICAGWWLSLAVSAVAPGRHRLLRGVAVAGAQVLFSLAERLVSEEGRAAIHQANQAAVADPINPEAPLPS
jgi:hypothetical protein